MQSRHSLELRNHQQLALTPQLQQSIRFLQLSALDLEAEIAQALQDNPLLERQADAEYDTDGQPQEPAGPESAAEEPRDDWANLTLPGRRSDEDGEFERPEAAAAETLAQHLLGQLGLTRAGGRDAALVSLLVDELDEDGYLQTPLEDIAACLPPELGVEPEELSTALRLLQSFDPPGVGARSLGECLVLQMDAADAGDGAQGEPEVRACARLLALHHLDLLASGNLARLRTALGCTQDTLRAAHALLQGLEPRPGRAWARNVADYVTPEVLVSKGAGGRWVARLNPSTLPRLRIDSQYERMLAQSGERGPLHEQLQQAHGLLRSVNQRFDTILRVAQAIVERQQEFFERGMQAMRPLVLRDIAEALGMHESTISRATRQKFAATPWGVLELKRFFGAALETGDGDTTSAAAVRTLIIQLVSQESGAKPLSDSQIAASLGERGVVIARRTVAKYREAAGIQPASLRKARAALESG